MSNEDFARDPNTPPEALAMLSTSPSDTVRLLVAGNPSTPVTALRHLALDTEKSVRDAVARNPRTPYDAFTVKEPPQPSQIGPVTQPEASAAASTSVSPDSVTVVTVPSSSMTPPPAPHEIVGDVASTVNAGSAAQTPMPGTESQVTSTPVEVPLPVEQPKKSLWQRFLALFGVK